MVLALKKSDAYPAGSHTCTITIMQEQHRVITLETWEILQPQLKQLLYIHSFNTSVSLRHPKISAEQNVNTEIL
jgi:hypothetical protein